ncbi:NAD-aldehyde dehydrogenase [Hymenopellis radicata]|nr:NAD-aldehyde dehydrogenase [Hymenopellis radicata]
MTTLEYTPIADIDKIHAELAATFKSGQLASIPFRKYVLTQIGYLVQDNAQRIMDAMYADFGKPAFEAHFTEVYPVLNEVADTLAHLDGWAKPEKPPFSMTFGVMRRVIYKQGKGVCLIIGPFNYPLSMNLDPLISAIAAGNSVVLKPSEATPAMSALLAELFPKYVDTSIVRVVNGGVEETTKLLELTWGHILFTGSARVGRIVGVAAAKTLSPVTLELGGMSPVFIDETADLDLAARRLMWGKCINAGQSCVAPGYILVPRALQDKVAEALKKAQLSFYPHGASTPGEFARLVHGEAFKRVSGMLKNTKGTIVTGGEMDAETKYIAPTVVKDVVFGDSLMSCEIFGPVMPIVPVDSFDEGLAYVRANDHPLAMYVFSNDAAFKNKIVNSTLSGSIVMNETMTQAAADGLPFGGVGASAGAHNGKYGFDTFTHFRASLDSPSWVDYIIGFRYPPYTSKSLKKSAGMVPSLPKRPMGPPPPPGEETSFTKWVFLLIAAVFAGGVMKKKVEA